MNRATTSSRKGRASNWRSVRMPAQDLAGQLQQRYSLRWHGFLIGAFTLALMWLAAHVQMRLGLERLSVRYLVTLLVGYLGYLLVLRVWAARLVRQREARDSEGGDWDVDLPDLDFSSGGSPSVRLPSGGGSSTDAGVGDALGDLAGGAFEAAAGSDEGAVVVVPVVAIFLIGAAVVLGAGSLAMLFFGWDVLLGVAVELAFSYATARAAMGVEREGWLGAAVRLTWKPLLGALVCAVALGASIDHFLPQVNSLPEAVRLIQAR